MKRITRIFVVVHVGCWVVLSLLAALQLSQETSSWLRLTTGFMATAMYVFYMYFFLLTRYSGKKKKGAYFLRLAAIILTAPFLYLFLHYKRFDTLDLFSEYYFISLFSIVVPFLFLGWLARVTENLVINTVKKEQLEKEAVEAELYYLKSQINPHFLFNTLNNIHTLVYKQAPAAPEAVMRLASLMRYMIYESNSTMVPLSKEMEYLQDYIGLQQLRYKKAPVVDLSVRGSSAACHIAPLLFIHLLENAYKHSPARLEPGDIKIAVEIDKDVLTFSVQNPLGNNQSNTLEEPGGIGLPNVKKRLQLLYPGKHSLTINNTDQLFKITLTIQGVHLPDHERQTLLLHH